MASLVKSQSQEEEEELATTPRLDRRSIVKEEEEEEEEYSEGEWEAPLEWNDVRALVETTLHEFNLQMALGKVEQPWTRATPPHGGDATLLYTAPSSSPQPSTETPKATTTIIPSPDSERRTFNHGTGVIVSGPHARQLLSSIIEVASPLEQVSLRARTLMMPSFTFADYHQYRPSLKTFLKAGVSLADLYRAGLARTYKDLRDELRFVPADLRIDQRLFSPAHLKQFYSRERVDWRQLLIDFGVGPYDYMLTIKLDPAAMATLELTGDILCEWPYAEVFAKRGQTVPGTTSMDSHAVKLRRALDREIFTAYDRPTEPSDWVHYLNLTWEHLKRIGVTGNDLMRRWGRNYQSLEVLLIELGYVHQASSPDDEPPLPFTIVKEEEENPRHHQAHRRRPHHHHHGHHRRKSSKRTKNAERKTTKKKKEEQQLPPPPKGKKKKKKTLASSSSTTYSSSSSEDFLDIFLPSVSNPTPTTTRQSSSSSSSSANKKKHRRNVSSASPSSSDYVNISRLLPTRPRYSHQGIEDRLY
jgi:hypothetical protein